MAGMQLLASNTLGGYIVVPTLSKKLQQPTWPICKFRQFVGYKEAFGKNAGESVVFDRFTHINTAGGTLSETSTIPRNNIVFSQGTLTVVEYGNAIGRTKKLEVLGQLNVDSPINQALRRDAQSVLDSAVADQFKDTLARYVCVTTASYTMTTNGTFGGTATADLNKYHIGNLVDQLKKWNVPTFPDGSYVCIASVAALRGIKNDTSTGGWIDAARYAGSGKLWTGEVGMYDNVRFVEETNVLSNAIGSATANGEAVIFGPGAVMEAVAMPEQVILDTPRDFGRDVGVGWYFIGGWKIIWCGSGETVDATSGYVPRAIYVGSA